MTDSPPRLLVISSAPGQATGAGIRLDQKFAEGMGHYARAWRGRTRCLLREDAKPLPFSAVFDPESLPFEIALRPRGHRISSADLEDADVVLCSGDNQDYLHVAELCRAAGTALFYIIEYIPETRRQIVRLDPGRSALQKLKSILHIQYHESRRRRAFRQATGLQANGYPAAARYRRDNPNTLLYLDNRIGPDLLATDAEMAERERRLIRGEPLRLIHSGRLEPMKGSQDLIAVARSLRARGVGFVLDIFGTGSLEGAIRDEARREGLAGQVRLHGAVDFARELVPFARMNSDIYLSCHRQSDPSCSYIENMGCGLAVAGYDNRMWQALARESDAGWVAPLGNAEALASRIAEAGQDRAALFGHCSRALDFARAHVFGVEFDKRIAQMQAAVG